MPEGARGTGIRVGRLQGPLGGDSAQAPLAPLDDGNVPLTQFFGYMMKEKAFKMHADYF